jgi:uncharacterized phiE125 gp8 family phage protein
MRKKIKYSPVRPSSPVDYNSFLSLETAKLHLRMDHDDDDDIIEIYRDAAMRTAEHETGRMVADDELIFYCDRLPGSQENYEINIPVLPISSIDEIAYYDGNDWAVIPDTEYRSDLISEPSRVRFVSTDFDIDEDTPMPIRITLTAGYSSSNVPQEFINGALLVLGSMYENRQDVVIGTIATKIPKGSEFLFQQLRIVY